MPTTIHNRCKPFLLRVMVFSPESGYKFTVEVQKACTSQNDAVWKLFFNLFKKIDDKFEELVSVEFVAGDPNEIEKIAAITDEGMKRSQVRAFRDTVYPLVKPFGDSGNEPNQNEQEEIDNAMRAALTAR